MRGAGDEFSIGERIAFYRRRRGLTQSVLAGLVGRSEDWLSKIERGNREIRRFDVLAEVAQALRVTMGDLLGQPVLVEGERSREDDIPAIRDALMSPRRLSRVLFGHEKPTSIEVAPVARLTELAWDDFQDGRLGAAISTLPALIVGAQQLEDTARDVADPRPAWAVSARVHRLGASTLAKIGEAELAWIAAERAMQAADRSDDPYVLASAARAGTHALLAVGRYDDAMTLGATASSWLREKAEADEPAALSLSGMLNLRTAVAAARHQDRHTCTALLEEAKTAADRLGRDANHWQTGFGPTNVKIHESSTALDLGDVAYVVERGPDVPLENVPLERSVEHRIDLARALSLVAHDDDAIAYLIDAEHDAPQTVRHSATVRETVRALLRRAPVTTGRSSPLFGLAERCRATG